MFEYVVPGSAPTQGSILGMHKAQRLKITVKVKMLREAVSLKRSCQ